MQEASSLKVDKHIFRPVCVAVFINLDDIQLPVVDAKELPLNEILKLALYHYYLPKSLCAYSDSILKECLANTINCTYGYITHKQLSLSPLNFVVPNKSKSWCRAKECLDKDIKITANYHLYNNESTTLVQKDLAYTEKSGAILRNLYDIMTGWPATGIMYLSAAIIKWLETDSINLSFKVYLARLLSIYDKFCNTNVYIRNTGPIKCPGYEQKFKYMRVELCAECYNFRNLYISKKFDRVCVCNDNFLDDVIYTCDTKTRKFVCTYLILYAKSGIMYYPEIVLDVNSVLSYSIKMNSSDKRTYDISTNQITSRREGRESVIFIGLKRQSSFNTCNRNNPCLFCKNNNR